MDIGDGSPLTQKPDVLVDQGGAFRKQRNLELWHGRHPVQVCRGGWIFCYHSEIRRPRKPAGPKPENLTEILSDFNPLKLLTCFEGKCRGQEV